MPSYWWVELGLGSLVGRTVSRGISRGGCGLRKYLDGLSVDGWDCVPTQLVVWPEVSQALAPKGVGWGQVFVLMS